MNQYWWGNISKAAKISYLTRPGCLKCKWTNSLMLLSYISDHLMTHLRSDILISYSFIHLMDTHTHTHTHTHTFSSFHSLSCVRLFVTPGTTARQTSLSITNSQSPPKPMSIESVMPSNPLILCCPRLLLPFFSQHQGLFNESAVCIRWPTYWSFSFNISPSNEHPGLMSFRMDWLSLFTVQGTLKSLL